MGDTVVVVLCAECKEVPIVFTPRWGDAKAWDDFIICSSCAKARGSLIPKGAVA